MAFRILSFFLLVSSLTFSQTNPPKYFTSYVYTQDDLPSGFDHGIFNPSTSGKTIYLDKIQIDLGLEATDTNPYIIFGTAVGLTFPSNCAVYGAINLDLTDPGEQTPGGIASQSVAKVVGQPCTGPVSTGNLGASASGSVDHYGCVVNKAKTSCTLDMHLNPLPILPGRGYFIYSKPSFHGTPIFGFEWHEQ
jgi:hypothetical protein